jgi:methionine-rich copper-binding protein CopC
MNGRISLCLALLLSLLVAPAASAHTVLIGSNPTAEATVSQLPESIVLKFADPLLTLASYSVNRVQVVDPMGITITSPDNIVKGSILSNVLQPSMVMSGIYKVTFRVAAQDGHVLNGSFSFHVGDRKKASSSIKVPTSGSVMFHAFANGKGVLDGVGSPTDTASGSFTINFGNDSFCYRITTTVKDLTAAHVHAASQKNMTISDEIFFPLQLSRVNSKSAVCQKEDGASLATLAANAKNYVFMLHSKKYPDGDVAGALKQ